MKDRFYIYQLKDDDSLQDYHFESFEHLRKKGLAVEFENYELVYEDTLEPNVRLEDLFYRFNMERPADFKGHSLSVSDIIVTRRGVKTQAFYVDSFGFARLDGTLGTRFCKNCA